MDRLFAALDIYCERTDASFWSEPVNALTNPRNGAPCTK